MVPETLEPSLQLASAVLSQLNMPQDEVAHAIQAFRKNHISELQVCSPWMLLQTEHGSTPELHFVQAVSSCALHQYAGS